jgi:hypothetical protein
MVCSSLLPRFCNLTHNPKISDSNQKTKVVK